MSGISVYNSNNVNIENNKNFKNNTRVLWDSFQQPLFKVELEQTVSFYRGWINHLDPQQEPEPRPLRRIAKVNDLSVLAEVEPSDSEDDESSETVESIHDFSSSVETHQEGQVSEERVFEFRPQASNEASNGLRRVERVTDFQMIPDANVGPFVVDLRRGESNIQSPSENSDEENIENSQSNLEIIGVISVIGSLVFSFL